MKLDCTEYKKIRINRTDSQQILHAQRFLNSFNTGSDHLVLRERIRIISYEEKGVLNVSNQHKKRNDDEVASRAVE